MTPKEHIQQIRNKYTSEKLSVNADVQAVIDNLSEISTNSILELATSIYKSDSHFMMELIQNADDNDYPRGVIPTLKIIQEKDRIIFQNNETGFKPNNVESLCDIKKSTKGIHNGEKGYIGEKGIGFKSVFRVTDQPEIYSNGYQFKFSSLDLMKKKRKLEKLSFILPEWIEKASINIEESKTHIVLPFKKALSESEKNKISDLRPDLPLFLNKIKKIEIIDKERNKHLIVEKKIIKNIVTLTTTNLSTGETPIVSSLSYLMIEKMVNVPRRINVPQRTNVKSAKVILAFPLQSKSKFIFDEEQYIYSYLPIDKYGFRFLIQADFILTSGRESIDEDNPWNTWMIDEVFTTFCFAIEQFKLSPVYKYSFLNFIPVENEIISDFWVELADEITEYCRTKKVLLSANNDWLRAGDVLLAPKETQNVFDNELLKSSAKYQYLHPSAEINDEVLETLNLASFNYQEVLICLQATKLIRVKSESWFIDMYSYVANDQELKSYLSDLQSLKFILIDSDTSPRQLVSPDSKVFLPLEGEINFSFEKELVILSRTLFTGICDIKKKDKKKKILDFFEELDIVKPNPYYVIKNYILPKYESNDWLKCSVQETIDHILYIKQNWNKIKTSQDIIIQLIRDKPILKTSVNNGNTNFFSSPESIYISHTYGNKFEVEDMLKDIVDDSFIDKCYLEIQKKGRTLTKEEEKVLCKEWYDFFYDIGCIVYPDYSSSFTRNHVAQIFKSGKPSQRTKMLQILESKWKDFSHYTQYDGWFSVLTESACIPIGKKLFRANELYKKDKTLQAFFGNSITYYPLQLSDEFAEAIGIHTRLSSAVVINYLIELSRKNTSITKDKATQLYRHLLLDDDADLSEFDEHKIIYLAKTKRWYATDELFWNDYKGIFKNNFGYCSPNFAPMLKELFVDRIGIKEHPSMDDYIEMLRIFENQISDSSFNLEDVKIIHSIFAQLGSMSMAESNNTEDFEVLNGLIWTNRASFWSNDNDVFYNDNPALFSLFCDEESIAFFDVPDNNLPKTKHLLRILNVPAISESVDTELKNQDFAVIDEKMTNKVRKYAETIISLVYCDYPLFYEQNKTSILFDNLRNIEIYELPEMTLTYTLNGIEKIANANSFHQGNCFFISREASDKNAMLAMEIASSLSTPQIFEFILLLLTLPKNTISFLLKQKNITVPPDESLITIDDYSSDTDGDHEYEDDKGDTLFDNHFDHQAIDEEQPDEVSTDITRITINNISSERWEPEVEVSKIKVDIEKYRAESEDEEMPYKEGRTFAKSSFNNNQKSNISHSEIMSQKDKDKIGDYGEEKVFIELIRALEKKYSSTIYLKNRKDRIFQIMEGEKILAEVKWLNDKLTVQEGYDIIVTERDLKKYYEVKTTRGPETIIFNVSPQQWNFIKSKEGNYSIVRVINAGKENIRLIEINNPFMLWKEGKLKACPVSIEL